jgi:hypothetical protein
MYNRPMSAAPIFRVIKNEHKGGQDAETMHWRRPGEEWAVKIAIQIGNTVVKRAVICCATESETKVGIGVWMWWTDRVQSDHSRVRGASEQKHRDGWRSFCSHLGPGQMEVYTGELWAIRLTL